jgi:flagellum-specific ATP synthase
MKLLATDLTSRLPGLENSMLVRTHGRVRDVVGLVVESNGPNARIGDLCYLEASSGLMIPAEVVGFRGDRVLLMPLGELNGVRAGCLVHLATVGMQVPVGEALLGRVLDGLGRPMDEGGPIDHLPTYPVNAAPPHALQRRMIQTPYATGVRAIDGMLTIGEGQRMGIFAGSGVGKSTLLGMIARHGGPAHGEAVNVICLVGERGREVREFIEHDLGPEGLARSVIICATSDQPALIRIKAAFVATAIAEYFRDQGAQVMLMMDSVTRFCMAQREVGLAVGEPPSTKGYTPSVFAMLPRLMERAGNSDKGSITALYTVLVDGDDTNEPIADAARSILDGHILLSRALTSRGHYPPIDVMHSLSRVMPMVTSRGHLEASRQMRELISAQRDVEDLVSIGAYKSGSQPTADRALERWELIQAFLRQDKAEATQFESTEQQLQGIVR